MILKWKSAENKLIEFTDKNKYILEDWSGFGYPTNNVKSVKSPKQIGNTIIGQVMDPRKLTISFKVITDNKDLLFQQKRNVIKAFNPLKKDGKLSYIVQNSKTYQIKAVAKQSPIFLNKKTTYQEVKIKLYAADPRWYNPTVNETTLNQSNDIYNPGDTDTPIILRLNGPMSNPLIINKSTGNKIKLEHSITSGEIVVINTRFGDKSIYLYDSLDRKRKALSLLSFDSQLFGLTTGSNLIEFRANNMDSHSKATISYKERYLGI